MDDYGSGVRWVHGLDLLEELEHPDRGERHPEIGPAGEVELGDRPLGSAAVRRVLTFTYNRSALAPVSISVSVAHQDLDGILYNQRFPERSSDQECTHCCV